MTTKHSVSAPLDLIKDLVTSLAAVNSVSIAARAMVTKVTRYMPPGREWRPFRKFLPLGLALLDIPILPQ
jgi:hypothetical protein